MAYGVAKGSLEQSGGPFLRQACLTQRFRRKHAPMDVASTPIVVATVVTIAGILGCWAADLSGKRILEYIGKPAASLAFVWLGFHTAGGASSAPVQAFLAALGLSLIGDMALMGRTPKTFLVGLSAFLLGHVAFVVAFILRGVSLPYVLASLPVLVAITVPVVRWLLPHVPAKMRTPVIAYIVVIGTMVVCAVGTHAHSAAPELLLAAVMFFVSDLAVARQTFVVPNGWNRYWGLPLYFGAQLIFAANVLR